MSLWKEMKGIPSSKKQLREFGLTVGGVLALIGGFLFWKGRENAVYFIASAVFLVLCGIVLPSMLKPLQKVWMALALVMGFVMSRVILCVLFFFVVTPIGLFLRITGKDLLDVRGPARDTYWKKRAPRPKEDYEKQF